MTIVRLISRLTLRNSAPARRLSTAPESATSKTQLLKRRSLLFLKVARRSSTSSIPDILNKWVDKGNNVKKVDIVNLMYHFRNHKNFRAALQLYDWMDRSNLEMNNVDQAVRIDLLCKTDGVASAEKYFTSLQQSEKTHKTYGALLSCYCRERVSDKALEIFEKMKVLNYATTLNYNNLLSLFIKIERPEKVLSLAQEMEEKNIPYNIFTFNLLINSYAALKDLDSMERVVEKMKGSSTKPDLFTYGNLATIYFNAGLHDKAIAFLELMENMKFQHNEGELFDACRTRIKLYSMMNDLAGVNRAWEALKSGFPTPSNTGYLLMLLALSKMGNKENLEKIFNDWEKSCKTYDFRLPNVVLEYYLNRGMIEEANALYKRMQNRGRGFNFRALSLFTNLCIKNNQIDLALKYLQKGLKKAKEQDSKWFPTDETIKLFVDYFQEIDDAFRAEKFIQSMKMHGRLDSNPLLLNFKASGK